MNDKKTLIEPILLYTCKCHMEYGVGMIIVAARNAFSAMHLIQNYSATPFQDKDLEQIVGATYIGKEHVISCITYIG